VRFSFLFNEVLTGLRRNVTMTIAMILTTAISVGLFGGGLLVIRLADHSREIYLDRVETQVYLDDNISANDPDCQTPVCKAVVDKIKSLNYVSNSQFLNRQQTYDDALHRNPQWKGLVTNEFFPASVMVKLDNPDQNTEFEAALSGVAGVKSFLNEKDLIDRLFAVLDGLSDAAFAVALVQAIGAILLIANMVQVAAYTRRTEVGIMRLVGATRWYTQLPFLVEAMVAATVGVILAIMGLLAVQALFLDKVLGQFNRDPMKTPLIGRVDYWDIIYISPWLLGGALLVAAATSYATLRLYVRR
jgi:cell division transport system permease protein